jgi:hypothetical protein
VPATRIVLVLVALCACHNGELDAVEPDRAFERVEPAVPAAPSDEERVDIELEPALVASERLCDWGVAIALPPSARREPCQCPHQCALGLVSGGSVTLSRATAPAPAKMGLQVAYHGDGAILDEGSTTNGVLWSIQTMQVRMGRSRAGTHIHWFEWVSRVLAVMPLDDASHVTCTGYLEHRIDSAEDASIQALADVCRSMRRLASHDDVEGAR